MRQVTPISRNNDAESLPALSALVACLMMHEGYQQTYRCVRNCNVKSTLE